MDPTLSINISQEKILNALTKALEKELEELLTRGYSNPLKELIEKEIKSHEGTISTIVREAISKALNDEENKKKLGDMVLQKIIEKGFKNL